MKIVVFAAVFSLSNVLAYAQTPTNAPTASAMTYDIYKRMSVEPGMSCTESAISTSSSISTLEQCAQLSFAVNERDGETSQAFVFNRNEATCSIYEYCESTVSTGDQNDLLYKRAARPMRGYSPWNRYFNQVTESIVLEQATKFKALGLVDKGFDLMFIKGKPCFNNVDGKSYVKRVGYSSGSRSYSASDTLPESTDEFPDIPGMFSTLRSQGYRIGWYTTTGVKTCNGFYIRQSSNFEQLVENDIQTFKDWGVEVLSLDKCSPMTYPTGQGGQNDQVLMSIWAKARDTYHPGLTIIDGKNDNCNNIDVNIGEGALGSRTVWADYCARTAEFHRSFVNTRPWSQRIFGQISGMVDFLGAASPSYGMPYGDHLQMCNYDWEGNTYKFDSSPTLEVGVTNNLEVAQIGLWLVLTQPLIISTDMDLCTNQQVFDLLMDDELLMLNEAYSGDVGRELNTTAQNLYGRYIWKFGKDVDTGTRHYQFRVAVDITESDTATATFVAEDEADELCDTSYNGVDYQQLKIHWTNNDGGRYTSIGFSCITYYGEPAPTAAPTPPTPFPTKTPTKQPTPQPTPKPTPQPTNQPTKYPTTPPVDYPTMRPTQEPTSPPVDNPTPEPTSPPSADPTNGGGTPTNQPTKYPTTPPVDYPTMRPTQEPTSTGETSQPTTGSDDANESSWFSQGSNIVIVAGAGVGFVVLLALCCCCACLLCGGESADVQPYGAGGYPGRMGPPMDAYGNAYLAPPPPQYS